MQRPMLSRWLRIASGTCMLAAAAQAQTFLIDLGPELDVPFVTYGAGSGMTGYWYGESGPFDEPQDLIDRWGVWTSVTIFAATAPPILEEDDPATSGDDDALCDDGARCGLVGDTDVWEFRELANGVYHVYTYVFTPNRPADRLQVEVPGSIDPQVTIGGPWPGAHVEGITFSRHRLIVSDGAIDVRTKRTSESATIDGFQIVRIDDSVDFGTSYCPANPNSTGMPADLWVSGTLDALRLRAEPLPEPGPALFFYGPTSTEIPFGNGKLCVGSPHKRLVPPIPVIEHSATLVVDLSHTGLSSIHLQCWFRDPAAGGAAFNLSDALALP